MSSPRWSEEAPPSASRGAIPVDEALEIAKQIAKLFEIRGLQGTGYDDYAVSPDGQRFLAKVPVQQARKAQLQIVTNWTSLLERR